MCERYSFTLTKAKTARRYGVPVAGLPEPNYNVTPGTLVPVLTMQQPLELGWLTWGLEPQGLKISTRQSPLVCLLPERLLARPALAHLLDNRRCLVLADGYYIWKNLTRRSQVPYRVSLKWNLPFAFAGVYDEWITPAGETKRTCGILLTSANELLRVVGPQMPAILPLDKEQDWLNPTLSGENALKLLRPYPVSKMKLHPVTARLGLPGWNSPELLEPAQEPTDQHGNYLLFAE